MKKIILTFMIVISSIVLIFVYNDDFLYSKEIMKITSINVDKESTSKNVLGLEEKLYEKKINGVITNGKNKGLKKTISYEEASSSVITDKYKVGDKLIIDSNDVTLKRDFYLAIMVVIFINLIYIVGSYKGLLSIVSVVLNMIIFYIGLILYFKGTNLLTLCVIEMILFSIISLVLASGINKKTFSAIISVIASTFVMLTLLLIVVKSTKYKGINFNEISFLTVPLEDIILPELLIGTVGAIMDTAITISSSVHELIEKNKRISNALLKKSTKEIGKDIMSTMMSVLFFTYLCAGLPIFVLAIRNGYSIYNYISTNFTLEFSRFLIGSIGIIIAIPISTYVSIFLLKRGKV